MGREIKMREREREREREEGWRPQVNCFQKVRRSHFEREKEKMCVWRETNKFVEVVFVSFFFGISFEEGEEVCLRCCVTKLPNSP